jgi:hypothetical protein
VRIRAGVAEERVASISDRQMRHGRKSRSTRIDGYKRHIAIANGVVLATAVTPANRQEHSALGSLVRRRGGTDGARFWTSIAATWHRPPRDGARSRTAPPLEASAKRSGNPHCSTPCMMAAPIAVTFVGGDDGPWRVDRIHAAIGPALPMVARLAIVEGHTAQPAATWALRGVTGHPRYTRRDELAALQAIQPGLWRAEASRASLIPIKKSEAWWDLAQDERRAIFEETSHHIAASMAYLPAIARRLYHSRELGEPFDFVTWFEYAPEASDAFEELVAALRETEEWRYVEREIDMRFERT